MGLDLATFLATFGAVVDGDGTSWSIDGGPRVGIGGSHSNYETDSSPLKGDLYQYGDLDKLIISQYQEVGLWSGVSQGILVQTLTEYSCTACSPTRAPRTTILKFCETSEAVDSRRALIRIRNSTVGTALASKPISVDD